MPDKRKDSLTNNTSKKLKSSDNGSGMSNWPFFYPKNYLVRLFTYLFFQFSDTDAGGHMSFDPVHFIRSHSKNNDPADIQTQVRNIFTIDCFSFRSYSTGFFAILIFWSPANRTNRGLI